MVGSELFARIAESVPAAQLQIAASMKQLVARSDAVTASLLNFADDAPFLEPLLFTCFSPQSTRVTLDQILYGYVPTATRPRTIDACTGGDGTLYLPRVGYIPTDLPDRVVAIAGPDSSGEFGVESSGMRSTRTCETVSQIPGTDIEIATHHDPLTDGLMKAGEHQVIPGSIDEAAQRHAGSVERAVSVLGEVADDLLASLVPVTRRVVVFHLDGLDSFASFSAHGTAFLQAEPDVDEVFFVEDLAHQCGHIIFNAMTLDRHDFFAVDPETPLKSETDNTDDHRTIYVAFHGLFTECLMCICLERCRRAGVFTGRQQHELLGRLSFILKRLNLDLLNLNREGLFSSAGEELYRMFCVVFDDVYEGARDQVVQFKLGNQPYAFRYEQFAAVNRID